MRIVGSVTCLLTLALVACGGDHNKTIDAPPPPVDAPPPIDAPTPIDAAIDAPVDAPRPILPLTVQAYCDTIQAGCTGTNAQYPSPGICTAAGAAFTPGATSTEMSGDTLGCRIYHAQNAVLTSDPATYCALAGPVGQKVDAATGVCGASPCDDFCSLDTKLCGTDAVPVNGVANRYGTREACMIACAAFIKTTPYSAATSTGNTFACRIFHLNNVALYTFMSMPDMVNAHCGHTLDTGGAPVQGPCFQ